MTLTDEEIRVKVAELMGWKFEWNDVHAENKNVTIRRPGGWLVGRYYVDKLPPCVLHETPNYPEDPAAALQLCDRMHSEGWSFVISRYAWKKDCTVTFYSDQTSPRREYKASDPSFARAVTLCFLAAYDTQKPVN